MFNSRAKLGIGNALTLVMHAGYFSLLNFSFKKLFQEHHQRFKQFVPRSGPTFSRAWSGYKLFAKVNSRQQKLSLSDEELKFLQITWSRYAKFSF